MIKAICVFAEDMLRIRLPASSAITKRFIDWRMMKFQPLKVMTVAALTGAMFCAAPYQALAQTDQVSRLCGETRYETAYEASKKLSSTSNTIILASGENFPDALAASALAGVNNAPILLTAKGSLSNDVIRWIDRGQTTKAFIVGGEAAISANVESALRAKGVETERIAGAVRQDTAAQIAKRVTSAVGTDTVIIANCQSPWDSLSISPYCNTTHSPVFLTEQNGTLSASTIEAVKASKATKAIIVGGPNAVKPQAEQALQDSMTVERWAGQTRYETSQRIADKIVKSQAGSTNFVAIASGENFPDALAGGPVVGSNQGVLLLTPKNSGSEIKSWLLSNRSGIQSCFVLGGCGAISPYVFGNIESWVHNGFDAPRTTAQSQSNAAKKANNYLRFMAFSRQGLVRQLKYEGFSTADAEYGTNSTNANWSQQALSKAKSYLKNGAFSYKGLISQLTSHAEQFTDGQAIYAAANCEANWFEQAAKKATSYQKIFSFSRSQMINQLIYDGFTQEQAEYGATCVGL